MTQKVMIAAGSQCFEFDGEITEVEEDYLILKAKHGDIYIERKYLVFIQYIHEEVKEVKPEPQYKSPKADAAAKFISKRLKHDPLDEKLGDYDFIPPSQLPDDDETPEAFDRRFDPRQPVDPIYGNASAFADDDVEVMKNVTSGKHMWNDTAITNASDLQEAVKTAMENEDHDFSMGFGGAKYKNPAQTILGMKNANPKKNRSS